MKKLNLHEQVLKVGTWNGAGYGKSIYIDIRGRTKMILMEECRLSLRVE